MRESEYSIIPDDGQGMELKVKEYTNEIFITLVKPGLVDDVSMRLTKYEAIDALQYILDKLKATP